MSKRLVRHGHVEKLSVDPLLFRDTETLWRRIQGVNSPKSYSDEAAWREKKEFKIQDYYLIREIKYEVEHYHITVHNNTYLLHILKLKVQLLKNAGKI